jgi:hypothetical protein
MFHVKQYLNNLKITEFVFLAFIITIPFQLRTILNFDSAFIGYYFSYPQAIFIYLSDLVFLTFLVTWFMYDRHVERRDFIFILGFLTAFTALFHVEQWGLWAYNLAKISQFLMILLFLRHNPRLFKPILWILVGSGVIQAGTAVWQFHAQAAAGLRILGEHVPLVSDSGAATINVSGQKLLRAYGTMPHPNVLGGFLAVTLFLSLYVSRETTKLKHRLYVSCGTIVIFTGLLVSFSRSAWLAALFGMGTMFIIDLIHNRTRQAIISWLFLIVSCGTLLLAYQNYVIPRSADVSLDSQAVDYRGTFNKLGFDVIKQHPITGIGLGQYVSYLKSTVEREDWAYQPPHNGFILVFAEIGIIGVILRFLMFYYLCFTWDNDKYQYYILNTYSSTLIGTLFVLAMLDHYLVTIQQGRLLLAVCIGLVLINQKNVSQPVKHFSEIKQ